jgi:hypothetical protein
MYSGQWSGAYSSSTVSADPRGEVAALLHRWKPRLRAVNVGAIGIGYNFGLALRDQGDPVRLINVVRACTTPNALPT